jgi:hypothetical protein
MEFHADQFIESFQPFELKVEGIADISTSIHKEFARDLWFVGIDPIGMNYGGSLERSELLEDAVIASVKAQFYSFLKNERHFRRANFCAEAYDMFTWATKEEDEDIEYIGLLFEKATFQIPEGLSCESFSETHNIVISC